MFFQPTIGSGGYLGWIVLGRTEEAQRETFDRSPQLQRDIDYFRENIASANTAEKLVNDRRLLTVALGAFGLGEEINKRAFIEKILNEGTEERTAFANRINDSRFSSMAKAFGYGNVFNFVDVSTEEFREDIIARFKTQEFERAIGESDNEIRLALNFRREIAEIANNSLDEEVQWFQVMGRRPVRAVMEAALNIPSEVAQLDIDRQQEIFADKAQQVFGDSSPAQFADSDRVEEAIRRFFVKGQLEAGPNSSTRGFAALSLLQGGGFGGLAAQNFFQSQF